MFILGVLAFFQTVFLPGYILVKYLSFLPILKDHLTGKIRVVVYSFALSLLINYLLVFSFTALGIYESIFLYIFVLIETLLFIYYFFILAKSKVRWFIEFDINKNSEKIKNFFAAQTFIQNILFLFSLLIISGYALLFFYFLGNIFEHWDPVVGWNRFALDWAANRLPLDTLHYPQLIPCNWSISYVMLKNIQVQCFAKAIMPLFSLAILLLFMDLGLRKRNNQEIYWLGLIIYGILLVYIHDPSYIVSGYVDIAVSFFAFLAFYTLQGHDDQLDRSQFYSLWFALIFASTAAITKQAGLFILVFIIGWQLIILLKMWIAPIIQNRTHNSIETENQKESCSHHRFWKEVSRNDKRIPLKRIFGIVILFLLTVGIISAPWYIYKEIQISRGDDRSEVQMVQHAHQTSQKIERFSHSFNRLLTHRHPKLKIIIIFLGLLIFLGIFQRQSIAVVLFIVIPFTVIWAFFFSYDFRNLTLAIPFMGFSAAFGVLTVKRIISKPEKIPTLKIPTVIVLGLLILGLLVLNFSVLKKNIIIKQQVEKKKKMGDSQLNQLLYQYKNEHGFSGKIATNYQYLKYLPGLEESYLYHPSRIKKEFLLYLDTLKGRHIHYILLPFIYKREKNEYQYFWDKIKKKKYQLIFKWKGYVFVKVN